MTISDVKRGLIAAMQTIFPEGQYKYYAVDVKEGYERPSFFTKLKPVNMGPANYNTMSNQFMFVINYMQEQADEAEALEVVQKFRDLFGLYIEIGGRAVKITGFDFDFVGSEQNIPEVTIDIEWMERVEHDVDNSPVMESAEINSEMEE